MYKISAYSIYTYTLLLLLPYCKWIRSTKYFAMKYWNSNYKRFFEVTTKSLTDGNKQQQILQNKVLRLQNANKQGKSTNKNSWRNFSYEPKSTSSIDQKNEPLKYTNYSSRKIIIFTSFTSIYYICILDIYMLSQNQTTFFMCP